MSKPDNNRRKSVRPLHESHQSERTGTVSNLLCPVDNSQGTHLKSAFSKGSSFAEMIDVLISRTAKSKSTENTAEFENPTDISPNNKSNICEKSHCSSARCGDPGPRAGRRHSVDPSSFPPSSVSKNEQHQAFSNTLLPKDRGSDKSSQRSASKISDMRKSITMQEKDSQTLYFQIGGDAVLERIVADLYDFCLGGEVS